MQRQMTIMMRLEQSGGKNLPIKRRQLRMYLKPYFGAMRLDGITAFTIDKYKKQRLDEGSRTGHGKPRTRHPVAPVQQGRRMALA